MAEDQSARVASEPDFGGAQPPEPPPNPAAERLRQLRELSQATISGAKAAADSAAWMAASDATTTAEAAAESTSAVAEALGVALSEALRGFARSGGAVLGGVKGTTGGLLMAAQISGAAALEAAKGVTNSSVRAAGRMVEGVAVSLEDQEAGTEKLRSASRDLAQELFDSTTGAALGSLGGLSTAAGAVLGGTKGAAQGAGEGLRRVVDAGAEATWVVGDETARGSAEVLRRALRRNVEPEA